MTAPVSGVSEMSKMNEISEMRWDGMSGWVRA